MVTRGGCDSSWLHVAMETPVVSYMNDVTYTSLLLVVIERHSVFVYRNDALIIV